MAQLSELKKEQKTEEEVLAWLDTISDRLKKNKIETDKAIEILTAELNAQSKNEIR